MSANFKLKEIAIRANLYKIFAECFKYPEKDFEDLLDVLIQEIVFYQNTSIGKINNNLECLKKWDLKELQKEYSKLFIGPYKVEAPLYSSVYLDEQGLVMGNSTQEAIKFYVEADLNPNSKNLQLPDSLSTELEFMYFLLFNFTIKKEEKFLILSNSFFSEHLSQWIFLFLERIVKSTQSDFYFGLAEILKEFIDNEKNSILSLASKS